MAIKTLFGIWKDRVPLEIQNKIEHQLNEMKLHADPDRDMSHTAVICYHLVHFVRREIDDRVCRILLLLDVMESMKQCGLGFDKDLYCEVEDLVSIIEEPVQNVLTDLLKEVKK